MNLPDKKYHIVGINCDKKKELGPFPVEYIGTTVEEGIIPSIDHVH